MQELMLDGEGESSTTIQEAGTDAPVRAGSSTSGRTSIAEAAVNFSQHSAAESSDRSKHTSKQLHHGNQSSSLGNSDLQLPVENLSKSSIDYSPGDLSKSEAIAEIYRREFEGLLERDERGDPVDEDRLYFLELYARRWIGENLDEDEMRDLNEFEESESHRAMIEAIKVTTEKAYGAAEKYKSYEVTACELPSILNEAKDFSEADPSAADLMKQGTHEEAAGELQQDSNAEGSLSAADLFEKKILEHDGTAEATTVLAANREGAEMAGELLTRLDVEAGSSGKLITNCETGKAAASQLPSSLYIEADPVVLGIRNESANSPVPMEPVNKVKKMKLNFNVYEIDPPSRLDNLKVSTANKAVNSGSVLRHVDAAVSRLQKGKAIHTNRIRRQLGSETGKLLGFLKPNGAMANANGLPAHSKTSDRAVLIAHAGTKLQKRENLRKSVKQNPASRLYATRTDNGSRRKARGRQNASALSLSSASARRTSRATHSKPKEEKYIMRTSRDLCGEKLKNPGRAARAGRNRGGTLQNIRLQGSRHRSTASSNRRKLATIIQNRHRSDGREEEDISGPPDVKRIPPRSNQQETAILTPEKSDRGFSKTGSATQQTNIIALTSTTNPIEETEIIKGATSSSDEMKENAIDHSDHFLSQLNKVDDAPAEQRGMSKAISVLQQNGGKLAKKHQRIHSSIRNERFLMATDLSYERILKDVPRLELAFSIAEWRHVHALMLYARVFQCELAAENIDQPREFSIYLPDSLQVFEPLGVVLASIGVVEDKERGVSYVPVAKPLQGNVYEPHNPQDVTVFMEWSQYKWNASWAQAKLERKRRKKDAENRGIGIPALQQDPNNRSKLKHWENLALEMWLGWDEELWFGYRLFVDSIARSFSFVDFPRSCTLGTYAWLIPSYSTNKGSYARIPNPSIGNAVWMIAMLFDLSDLPSQNTASWFCKTDTIDDIKDTLLRFLDSAVKT